MSLENAVKNAGRVFMATGAILLASCASPDAYQSRKPFTGILLTEAQLEEVYKRPLTDEEREANRRVWERAAKSPNAGKDVALRQMYRSPVNSYNSRCPNPVQPSCRKP